MKNIKNNYINLEFKVLEKHNNIVNNIIGKHIGYAECSYIWDCLFREQRRIPFSTVRNSIEDKLKKNNK
jgi:hypothetical protein